MFLEIAIGSALVAAGVVALRALRRHRDEAVSHEGAVSQPASAPPARGPRGLCVGDVLLHAESEYWLAGQIGIDEEGFVLRIFTSPGGTRATHIAQLDPEAKDIAFLRETTEVPDGRLPVELPVGGYRLALWKRGHGDLATTGEHLPPTTGAADYTLLGGPGGRLLIVLDCVGGDRIALFGERVMRETVDVLPGGDAT